MNSKLTTLQAFNAMIKFLDDYYKRTLSDDIGSLLGDMSFLEQGYTADPATWHDWISAIKTNQPVTILQAFNAMIKFLDDYYKRTASSSDDIRNLLNSMQFSEKDKIRDRHIWKLWINCVGKTLREPKDLISLRRLVK